MHSLLSLSSVFFFFFFSLFLFCITITSVSNRRAVAYWCRWTREKEIRRREEKCLTLFSFSLHVHLVLFSLLFRDNNNNHHHHQRRRTTMRSPTLNNNHPSPHEINPNKPPTQSPQQTNGNGVKIQSLHWLSIFSLLVCNK